MKKVGARFLGKYEPSDTLWGFKMEQKVIQSETDLVNHPAHYASGGIECIDAMEAMTNQSKDMNIRLEGHDYYLWQVIFKYLWRFPYKEDPLTDLKKLLFYLNKLIIRLETYKKENK